MFVVHIGGDPNNAVWRPNSRLFAVRAGKELEHGIGPVHMPIDRILTRKHALCESRTDDHDRLFTLVIDCVETAALHTVIFNLAVQILIYSTPLPAIVFVAM